MYNLTFEVADKAKYDLIYEALIGSGQKSLEEDAVTFIDVLKKLRTIGTLTEDENYKRSKIAVYVFDHAGTVSLTKAEYNCLKSTYSKSKFQPWALELAQEIKEWLDGIKASASTESKS